MRELGQRMLREEPQRIYDALQLLVRASAEDAQACALIATLAGAGAGTPQSWPIALDYLARAAELGSAMAQRQLQVLAQPPGSEADAAATRNRGWRELTRRVGLDVWLSAPPASPLPYGSRLIVIPELLPSAACDWLIERARPLLLPASTYDPTTGAPQSDPDRSNSTAEFDLVETDLVLLLVRARIASVLGMPPTALEYTNVLHYRPGQEFKPHYDFLDPTAPGLAREIQRLGQRVATCLVYLNNDYLGGQTEFPRLGLRHRGKGGDALLFHSIDRTGTPDLDTLHAGLPPTRGEKWLLSQFVRLRPTPIDGAPA
ncbi:MAG: 2OG-Fe(II) oxygenase [Gammaproteobacteria bacterium]|nr:2OG-Fe(II) oxygenase [Gammaproteobacteria bacterium]